MPPSHYPGESIIFTNTPVTKLLQKNRYFPGKSADNVSIYTGKPVEKEQNIMKTNPILTHKLLDQAYGIANKEDQPVCKDHFRPCRSCEDMFENRVQEIYTQLTTSRGEGYNTNKGKQ